MVPLATMPLKELVKRVEEIGADRIYEELRRRQSLGRKSLEPDEEVTR